MTKTCRACHQALPIAHFYKTGRGERLFAQCKTCLYERRKPHIKANWAAVRAYAMSEARVSKRKQYAESERGREKRRSYLKRYREANRDKINARAAVYRALRRGDMSPAPCETCGEIKSEAHHDDYSLPLSVRWLCSKHHAEFHQNQVAQNQV